MGSLTSRPDVSAVQTQAVATPQTTTASADTTDSTSLEEAQTSATQVRSQNLIGRERARFGTVLTGFRGLLGASENTTQRKTLLGE